MGNSPSGPASVSKVCMGLSGAAFTGLRMLARDTNAGMLGSATTNSLANVQRATGPKCRIVQVKPPPPQLQCNEYGTLANPRSISSGTAKSLNACSTRCLKGTACASFSYGAAAKRCTTYKASLKGQGFKSSTKKTANVYFDRKCFKQQCSNSNCKTFMLTSGKKDYVKTYWKLRLPFPVRLYGLSSAVVNVTSDGQISLKGNISDADYPQSIPAFEGQSGGVADDTGFLPYWSIGQGVAGNTPQKIYVAIQGAKGKRNITFFWSTSFPMNSGAGPTNNRYAVLYSENKPGIWKVFYDYLYRGGDYGVIGMQSYTKGQFLQWEAYDEGAVANGTVITFNSNTNTAQPPPPA